MDPALVLSFILIGYLCDTGAVRVTSQVFTCSFLLMLSHLLTPAVKKQTAEYAKILGALPVTIATRGQASPG